MAFRNISDTVRGDAVALIEFFSAIRDGRIPDAFIENASDFANEIRGRVEYVLANATQRDASGTSPDTHFDALLSAAYSAGYEHAQIVGDDQYALHPALWDWSARRAVLDRFRDEIFSTTSAWCTKRGILVHGFEHAVELQSTIDAVLDVWRNGYRDRLTSRE